MVGLKYFRKISVVYENYFQRNAYIVRKIIAF
jgi:hypothetical protein